MHFRAALAAALFAVVLGAPARAAEPAPPPAAPADSETELARAHFKTGIKLYRDGNYAGALAEFEAAYEQKPGPGSLQNVALCQKALFRYGEAADTLTRLLLRHDAELSEAERTAARLARDELTALVGSVRLKVTPPDALVTLDGQPVSAAQRLSSIRVNVGEHVVVAEAPGYARASRTVRVAGGKEDVPFDVTLEAVLGFLDITASDSRAAIAIDGTPVALGHFIGPVTPGDAHLVQVYLSGFEPFEDRVRVDVGKTLVVAGKLGRARPDAVVLAPTTPGGLPAPPEPKPPVGWFGVLAVRVQSTGVAPFNLSLSEARSFSGSLGTRVGRRIRTNVALEGLFELGALSVDNACDLEPVSPAADGGPACGLHYSVRWARLGPNVRLMTAGDRLRLEGALGAGVVWHQLRLPPGREPGVDPYLLIELGVASNWRKFLFGLDLFALLDGTRAINAERDGRAAFPSGRALSFIGLGVRVGYSEWGAPP